MATKSHKNMDRFAPGSTFRTFDGCELYFEDSGAGASKGAEAETKAAEPTLVFIYGLACSIQHWKYAFQAFSKGDGNVGRSRRCIWLDLRGHGRSGVALGHRALTVERLAQDYVELIEYLGLDQVVLLGQSMGGVIALEVGALLKERVAGVVLLATPGRDPLSNLPLQPLARLSLNALHFSSERTKRAVPWSQNLSRSLYQLPIARQLIREVVRAYGFNGELSRTTDIEEYLDNVFQVPLRHFLDLAKELRSYDIATVTWRLTVPILILAGGRDHIVKPEESRRLQRYLPGSKLHFIPHGSHCPHFDDPAEVNRRVSKFLNSLT